MSDTATTPTDPIFGEVIFAYTRADAIADGVLVDVSETAAEAGIRLPVALTADAFADMVTWTRGDACQDESGRLWDVVWMLRDAIRRSPGGTDRVAFTVYRIPNKGRGQMPRPVRLQALCGPGDPSGAPVVTVGLATESL